MSHYWKWYKSVLHSHPLATKAVTASLLMSASDVLSQTIEHQVYKNNTSNATETVGESSYDDRQQIVVGAYMDNWKNQLTRYDWTRTLHVGITGLTFGGPITHVWYNLLERYVTASTVRQRFVWKMVLDAIVFSPVAVGGYFVSRSILEGHGWDGIMQKLKEKWSSGVVASWSFWPTANVM